MKLHVLGMLVAVSAVACGTHERATASGPVAGPGTGSGATTGPRIEAGPATRADSAMVAGAGSAAGAAPGPTACTNDSECMVTGAVRGTGCCAGSCALTVMHRDDVAALQRSRAAQHCEAVRCAPMPCARPRPLTPACVAGRCIARERGTSDEGGE